MGYPLKRTITYDTECEKLARHMLGSTVQEAVVQELAAHIQFEIESWINYDERISNQVKAGKA